MSKPNWSPSIGDVLGHETKSKELISKRTGSTYITDIIPILKVTAISAPEATPDGKWKYPIVDRARNLDYSIKVAVKLDVSFGDDLIFTDVRGGAGDNPRSEGWFGADNVTKQIRNS